MKWIKVLLTIAVGMLWIVGCGDESPVSSDTEGDIAAPAAKLTISATKAGGYPGRRGVLAVETASRAAFNAHDVDGFLAYWTDDGVMDYVAAGAPMTGKEQVGAFFDTFQLRSSFGII